MLFLIAALSFSASCYSASVFLICRIKICFALPHLAAFWTFYMNLFDFFRLVLFLAYSATSFLINSLSATESKLNGVIKKRIPKLKRDKPMKLNF